jgi:hypothetical protein
MVRSVAFLSGALFFVAVVFSSCVSFKKSIDNGSLRDLVHQVLADSGSGSAVPGFPESGKPAALEKYLSVFSLSGSPAVTPDKIIREPFSRWKLSGKASGGGVTGELLHFQSSASEAPAFFYFFHGESWSGKKAILWAPGFGVSDFAFVFIRRFFGMELSRDWAVLVWVPPFHLERQSKGKKAGEGIITLNPQDLMGTMASSVRELSAAVAWLESIGVTRIGGWGGSFGAANILLLATYYRFDHLSLMIPLVDWSTPWKNPELEPLRLRYASEGYTDSLLSRAFRAISPVGRKPLTPPGRLQVLYARYDQLTPETVTASWAESLGPGADVRRYNQSHGSILLDGALYRDYAAFLDAMK